MARVILICGKLCAGKSHYARRIQEREHAVILSCDEIMFDLFDGELGEKHDDMSVRIQRYFLKKAAETVNAGANVILEWGFWTIKARRDVRAFFAESGIQAEMHYIDTPDDVWRSQIARRNEAVRMGQNHSYIVDEGLMHKFESLFEAPLSEEIDIWYKNEYQY